MPPAVIAGVGAAASIGGAIIGSKATKKAGRQAADAQVGMARENNALAREFRSANEANFAPWLQSGGRANALIDSFLYGPQAAQPAPQPQVAAPQPAPQMGGRGYQSNPGWREGLFGNRLSMRDDYGSITAPMMDAQPQAQPGTVNAPMTNGYETFVNSPYYQNPLNEGMRQINTGYAARGMLESGDAMKAINRFGQDYAHGRQGEFLGLAGQQSDRGLQGAGAIAGVGMNALSSMSGNNQNAANAMSNAAIARGVSNANMWSGVGGAIGNLAGTLIAPTSYGRR